MLPTFPLSTLTIPNPHFRNGESYPTLPRVEYLCKLFGIFLPKRLAYSPLFIILLIIYGLEKIYFILCVII